MGAKNTESKERWYVKVKNFITVEPILLAVAIPFFLQHISIQNFALEKVSFLK